MTLLSTIPHCTDLGKLESIVERGRTAFLEVALALTRIRDARLYKETHQTFEAYCKDRWGWGRDYAYKLIKAGEVAGAVGVMSTAVDITSERQARELAKAGDPSEQADVWQEAVQRSGGAAPTAAVIREVVEERQAPADDLPPPEVVARGEKEILAAAKEIRAEKTERRRQERVARIVEVARNAEPLRPGIVAPHPVILSDPPWEYEEGSTDPSREIENHYDTMTLEEICALPVPEVCTPDAVLYLWATSAKLEEAFRVIHAWGFRYRSSMVWDKMRMGMGYWARIRHELLLIAVRGDFPTPPPALRPDSIFAAPMGAPSEKPAVVHELLERLYPDLPKLELFARAPRDGWSVWGNESRGAA